MDTVVPATGGLPEPPAFENLLDQAASGEDKQELERQRLLTQASAPPDDDDGVEPASGSLHDAVPTAPREVDDDENYTARTLYHEHTTTDHLPQYER